MLNLQDTVFGVVLVNIGCEFLGTLSRVTDGSGRGMYDAIVDGKSCGTYYTQHEAIDALVAAAF